MMTAAKNAIVSWLLNLRIRMFVKSAVRSYRIYSIKRRPRLNAVDEGKIINKLRPRINAAPN